MSITKGPWFTTDSDQQVACPYTEIVEASQGFLGVVAQSTDGCPNANARAISKVPEMVEAIQGLLTLISNEQPNWSFEEISEAQAILDYIEQEGGE